MIILLHLISAVSIITWFCFVVFIWFFTEWYNFSWINIKNEVKKILQNIYQLICNIPSLFLASLEPFSTENVQHRDRNRINSLMFRTDIEDLSDFSDDVQEENGIDRFGSPVTYENLRFRVNQSEVSREDVLQEIRPLPRFHRSTLNRSRLINDIINHTNNNNNNNNPENPNQATSFNGEVSVRAYLVDYRVDIVTNQLINSQDMDSIMDIAILRLIHSIGGFGDLLLENRETYRFDYESDEEYHRYIDGLNNRISRFGNDSILGLTGVNRLRSNRRERNRTRITNPFRSFRRVRQTYSQILFSQLRYGLIEGFEIILSAL